MPAVAQSHGHSLCHRTSISRVSVFSTEPPQAPSEAEAQCAELARGGKVYAAGSEDMDTLTFNAPVLFRHLTFSEAKKQPISEIRLDAALAGLGMDMSQVCAWFILVTYQTHAWALQFIDLCILLGCDYLEPIKGVGPKSALKLIREFGTLKAVVEHLREKLVHSPVGSIFFILIHN